MSIINMLSKANKRHHLMSILIAPEAPYSNVFRAYVGFHSNTQLKARKYSVLLST